jgi:hypothetical protein
LFLAFFATSIFRIVAFFRQRPPGGYNLKP